jgi:hypothetical protein
VSELGDYRRLVEKPAIAGYEATIASLRLELVRSHDALQQLVDYVKDGLSGRRPILRHDGGSGLLEGNKRLRIRRIGKAQAP